MKNGNYELIIAPEYYPGIKYRKRYAYEHVIVWWKYYGKLPEKNMIIHHKNGNYRDNKIENLELMTRSDHTKHHYKPPPIVEIICKYCNKLFKLELRKYKSRIKSGQKNFFCCRQHQVKQQWIDKKNNKSTL